MSGEHQRAPSLPTVEHERERGVVGADGDFGLARRAQLLRRIGVVVILVFVVAGATTLLGVRSQDVTAQAGDIELIVHHAAVTRPGLATPWAVTIRQDGGFGDQPIRVAVTQAFLDSFDENGLDPDPAASTATDTDVIWEFDPPPGDVIVLSFDARVEPAVAGKREGRVAILDDDDSPLVEVPFTMWVLP